MTPAPDEAARYTALRQADRNLETCVLLFPVAAAAGAFLIGFWSALHPDEPWSGAPLWLGLAGCGLLLTWAWFSARSARRGLVRIEVPANEIRRRLAGMWTGASFLMIAIGAVALGVLRMTWDPARHRAFLFIPVLHPRPLVVALLAVVLGGALLLGKSVRDRWRSGGAEGADDPEWTRLHARSLANRRGEGVLLFVLGGFLLALVVGVLRTGLAESIRWGAAAFFTILSVLGALAARRSRRAFEVAGSSPEEARDAIASTWRVGAVAMILLGAVGLGLLYLGAGFFEPRDLRWAVGSALVCSLTGSILFLANRSRRGA